MCKTKDITSCAHSAQGHPASHHPCADCDPNHVSQCTHTKPHYINCLINNSATGSTTSFPTDHKATDKVCPSKAKAYTDASNKCRGPGPTGR